MKTGLFNCDVLLWQNSLEAHRSSRSLFQVIGPHIYKSGCGIVARFETFEDAVKCLTDAGYKPHQTLPKHFTA